MTLIQHQLNTFVINKAIITPFCKSGPRELKVYRSFPYYFSNYKRCSVAHYSVNTSRIKHIRAYLIFFHFALTRGPFCKMAGCVNHNQIPELSPDGMNYNIWKKEIDLWCQVTTTAITRRAPQIYFSLKGKGRTGAMKIPHEQLKTNDGVKILLQHLDEVFLPNKAMRLFNANNKLRSITKKQMDQ